MYAICPLKWVVMALPPSTMRSMNSGPPAHRLVPSLCSCALPVLPEAQPMAIFLSEPPKPPIVWPLKWVSTSMES